MGINRRTALKGLVVAGASMAGATRVRASGGPIGIPADAVGLLYDTTLCIGCKACVVACNEANGLKPDPGYSEGLYQAPADLNEHTKNIIKLYDDGSGRLVNPQSGKCLDAFGGSSANGTRLIIWTCHTAANQRWTLP